MHLVLMSLACTLGSVFELDARPDAVLVVDTIPSSNGSAVTFSAYAGKAGTRLFTVRNARPLPQVVTFSLRTHEQFRITSEPIEPPDADGIARALSTVTLTVPPHSNVMRTIIFTPTMNSHDGHVHSDVLRVTTPDGVDQAIVLFGTVRPQ